MRSPPPGWRRARRAGARTFRVRRLHAGRGVEHAPDFELLEPFVTLESNQLDEEGMRELLLRYPDIVGVFVAGDGTNGVLRALREHREAGGARVVGVARELTATPPGTAVAARNVATGYALRAPPSATCRA
jgi:ABC-type sugar transport system substrate-binding protein